MNANVTLTHEEHKKLIETEKTLRAINEQVQLPPVLSECLLACLGEIQSINDRLERESD